MINVFINQEESQKLRAYIDAMQRLPYICVVPAALTILPSLATKHNVPTPLLIIAGILVFGALGIRSWYRANPDSVIALLLFNASSAPLLVGGFLAASWEMRHFSRLQWLYIEYGQYYLVVFLGIWGYTAFHLIKHGVHLHKMYENLRTYLPQGEIADYQLARVLLSAAPGVKDITLKIRTAGGIAVSGTMLAGAIGGSDSIAYVYFLALLTLTPFLLGIATARVWALWKYLRWQDLLIRWN
jgi:hypothetical protein